MPLSLREQLKNALKELINMNPQILFAGLVRSDGLPLATTFAEDINIDLIAATVAGVFNMAKNAMAQLKNKEIENVMITGDENIIIITHVYDTVSLAIVARKNTNLGYTFLALRSTKKRVEELLKK